MLIICLCFYGCQNIKQNNNNDIIAPVNLDGLTIYTPNSGPISRVEYRDEEKWDISNDTILIFVNGNILYKSSAIVNNDTLYLPMAKVCAYLNNTSYTLNKGSKAVIQLPKATVEVNIANNTAVINDRNVKLNEPIIEYNGELFISILDVEVVLGASTSYYNYQDDVDNEHILLEISHVIVDSYPDGIETLSSTEALRIAKDQFVKAYENVYGDFKGSDISPDLTTSEKDRLAYSISNLQIESENNRFYHIPMNFEFWVDKFTGELYVYYNGVPSTVNLFDPMSDSALSFAG